MLLVFTRILAGTAIVVFLAVLFLPAGCQNPNDFKPPEDTLLPPPPAPSILAPPDSYLFIPVVFPAYVNLQWSEIESAEVYQVELARIGDTATLRNVDSSYYSIGFPDDTRFGNYVWRVRASSTRWLNGYTAWSPYFHFGIAYQPRGPLLIKPEWAESIFVDTLPKNVAMEWTRVRDETFYDVKIFLDSLAVVESVTGDTFYEFWADEPGHYYWQVRANSWHWQMPGRWAYSNFYLVLNKGQ